MDEAYQRMPDPLPVTLKSGLDTNLTRPFVLTLKTFNSQINEARVSFDLLSAEKLVSDLTQQILQVKELQKKLEEV